MLKEKKRKESGEILSHVSLRLLCIHVYAAKWLLQLNVGKRPNQQMYHDMYLKS